MPARTVSPARSAAPTSLREIAPSRSAAPTAAPVATAPAAPRPRAVPEGTEARGFVLYVGLDELKAAFPVRIEVRKEPVLGSTFEIVGE